jgi:O-antigen ligase
MTPAPAPNAASLAARASPALAWVLYLPLGAKYALALGAFVAAVWHVRRHRSWPRVTADPAQRCLALLLTWLALTAAWTPAPPQAVVSHLWTYGLALGLPWLVAALDAAWCRRALVQFAVASAFVGGLVALRALDALPASPLWASTVDATGNQRIATSLLMALGAAIALWLAAAPNNSTARRTGLLSLAALASVGLSLQDRRTGMLMLPVLLLVWTLARPRSAVQRAAMALAILAASAFVWAGSEGVRQRFAEGLQEIAEYRSSDEVASSWGLRLRMFERTAEMVRERPWTGHGVGSWAALWQQRTPPGSRLADNSTPHNDYLHLAQQGGLPAVLLLLAFLGVHWWRAWRAGPAGVPLLMVWTAVCVGALFNAVLRDAKFALPLLLLAAAAAALGRIHESPVPGWGVRGDPDTRAGAHEGLQPGSNRR